MRFFLLISNNTQISLCRENIFEAQLSQFTDCNDLMYYVFNFNYIFLWIPCFCLKCNFRSYFHIQRNGQYVQLNEILECGESCFKFRIGRCNRNFDDVKFVVDEIGDKHDVTSAATDATVDFVNFIDDAASSASIKFGKNCCIDEVVGECLAE